MLAPNEAIPFDSEFLKFPLLVSDKLDGMRCLIFPDGAYSRNMKLLRSGMQDHLEPLISRAKALNVVFDGELYIHGIKFGPIMSNITNGEIPPPPNLLFYGFDCVFANQWGGSPHPFRIRQEHLNAYLYAARSTEILEQREVRNAAQLEEEYDNSLARGYEGIIARDPDGRYKHNRGTLKEGLIFKFKEWVTEDAQIIGYEQATRMKTEIREGERTRDVFGHLERSHKQDTREVYEGIGSILVRLRDGTETGCGIARGVSLGITWANRLDFVGKWVEIRYMKHGAKDKPRFAGITRFRPDLEE